jgi:hypothetical protein
MSINHQLFMTRYHFNILDENEKANTIWSKGVLIGERADAFHKIMLYQVDAFYVEVYHHTHFNVITKMQSFSSTHKLQPYLEAINLDDLV